MSRHSSSGGTRTSSGDFSRKIKEGKGTEFAEYFRRNMCPRQILERIVYVV